MKNKFFNFSIIQKHPYHIVDSSPWPLFLAFNSFVLILGLVLYMHSYKFGGFFLIFGLILILYLMACWWRDIIREATFEGFHTKKVQKGLSYGMILFIISEFMFFIAFFWTFFHTSLAPIIEIGGIWPPKGIEDFNPWHIPFLNTLILLLSGSSITWSHYALIQGVRKETVISLYVTLLLALTFMGCQIFEYINVSFNITDSIYGSIFYLFTGFHGVHVFIGICFISVSLLRLLQYQITKEHHLGFEFSAIYWHFVDIIWLILFIFIYWWGGF